MPPRQKPPRLLLASIWPRLRARRRKAPKGVSRIRSLQTENRSIMVDIRVAGLAPTLIGPLPGAARRARPPGAGSVPRGRTALGEFASATTLPSRQTRSPRVTLKPQYGARNRHRRDPTRSHPRKCWVTAGIGRATPELHDLKAPGNRHRSTAESAIALLSAQYHTEISHRCC
jgi:hypothetical protein